MTTYEEIQDKNALEITDAEVAADWRLGLTRALARIILEQGAPLGGVERFGQTVPGSNREHVEGARVKVEEDGVIVAFRREPACPLVSIRNITEEHETMHEFSTMGGSSHETTLLSAYATCACGKFDGQVSASISAGELILRVTQQ